MNNKNQMNDDSIMPFGKYEGRELGSVPDDWLLWFWGENKTKYKENYPMSKIIIQLMEYIEDSFNHDQLL